MATEFERLTEVLAGRYRVDRELGRGGMATVYLAHDLRHGRAVALKVLRPELAVALGTDRFLREITLTARLDHPHILPLLDSGEAGGVLYYVMPYVEGESLRDRLSRETQLPLADALAITRDVAGALSYAHSLGIVHRDIKPENILLAAGHARVADFGIARAVTAASASLTETGLAVGTPAYMSPEQASGLKNLDQRSDVYSLACVTYEMLAGEPPWTAPTAAALVARKSMEPAPSLRHVRGTVPEGVDTAIRTALSIVPADRFATAAQFADALQREHGSDHGRLPFRFPLGRRALMLMAAALVLVLAAAWVWVGGRNTVAPGVRAIAVLPFSNLSGDPEQEYFAYGMTEELIARLSDISGLTVKSRTSVMGYRGSNAPLPSIAAKLGVDALVEGSVWRQAGKVRIRAQLVRARPERSLWSGTYDRDLTDMLALQSDVARTIATEIGGALTPEDEGRLARASNVDPVAADAYFKGRFYWNRRTSEDLQTAIRYFEQAITADPRYARPHVGLADCYLLLARAEMAGLRPAEALAKARTAALTALEIDGNLAEAHTSLAYVDTYAWNWEAAERGFQRALALDPDYGTTYFWYAVALAAVGRIEEAVERARQGQQLEPVSPIITAGVAWMLHFARRYDDAAREAHRTLELEPGFAIGRLRLGVAYGLLGRYADAITELQSGLSASGGSPTYAASLARVYAAAGRPAEARQQLADLLGAAQHRYVPAYSVALVYAALGDRDQGFAWLERAFEEHSLELATIGVDPEMDPLRADPRFEDLLRRMHLPDRLARRASP